MVHLVLEAKESSVLSDLFDNELEPQTTSIPLTVIMQC